MCPHIPPCLRFLAASALFLLFAGEARADTIPGVCNSVNIDDIDQCIFSWGTGSGQSAHLTLNASDSVSAGLDSFANYLKATYTTAGAPQGYNAANSMVWGPIQSFPTWNVATTPASLLLTGSVEFSDANRSLGSIELDLNGWLAGGGSLEIDATVNPGGTGSVTLFDSGTKLLVLPQTASCPLGFCALSALFPVGSLQIVDPALDVGSPALEWLNIDSVGRVIYEPDNPFVGATPEPASLVLLAVGLLALGTARRNAM